MKVAVASRPHVVRNPNKKGVLGPQPVTSSSAGTVAAVVVTDGVASGTERSVAATCQHPHLHHHHNYHADQRFPYLECDGDYRKESCPIEDPSLPLYQHQATMPRLPVPTLEQSIETFLPTALPLAEAAAAADDTEDQQYKDEVASLLQACRSFPMQAAKLQERLLKRASSLEYRHSSWLQEWWNQLVYLEYRESLFHVSYLFRLQYDDSCNANYIQRAAAALQATAVVAQSVITGQQPAELLGRQQQPLCSTQYKYLFHACRIPGYKADSCRIYAPTPHVVVIVNGQFFTLPIWTTTTTTETDIDGTKNTVPALWSRQDIAQALQSIVQQAQLQSQTQKTPQLGWLPSLPRDEWYKAYSDLSKHPKIKAALEELQSALCVLSLDLEDHTDTFSPTDVALRLWHGNHIHSSNRWLDKSFSLVVNQQGHLGYVGEHSMADGMPALTLCNYLTSKGRVDAGDTTDLPVVFSSSTYNLQSSSSLPSRPTPKLLFESAFSALHPTSLANIQAHVNHARRDLTQRIHDHDLQVLTFEDFGASSIKQKMGCSPDAFVQLAMQLASYRLYGNRLVGTYEATQTRAFLHGRTETARSVSHDALGFVQAMCSRSSSDDAEKAQTKRVLLQKAANTHSTYTRKAVKGLGCDRHFFGLSMLLNQGQNDEGGDSNSDSESLPDLFTHPLFIESKRWRLSTSTVPGLQTGFSPVEPDGLGIGYDVQRDQCVFTITARRETGYAKRFHDLTAQALREMAALFEEPSTKEDTLKSNL